MGKSLINVRESHLELQTLNKNFFAALIDSINRASMYNKDDQSAPVVVLWTDKERLWETLIPQVRQKVHLLTFDPVEFHPGEERDRILFALSFSHLPVIVQLAVFTSSTASVAGKKCCSGECPKALQPLANGSIAAPFLHRKIAMTGRLRHFCRHRMEDSGSIYREIKLPGML
jgi:hypothetical protein